MTTRRCTGARDPVTLAKECLQHVLADRTGGSNRHQQVVLPLEIVARLKPTVARIARIRPRAEELTVAVTVALAPLFGHQLGAAGVSWSARVASNPRTADTADRSLANNNIYTADSRSTKPMANRLRARSAAGPHEPTPLIAFPAGIFPRASRASPRRPSRQLGRFRSSSATLRHFALIASAAAARRSASSSPSPWSWSMSPNAASSFSSRSNMRAVLT